MRRRPHLTEAINVKLTETDYKEAARLAGDGTVTEWARNVIKRELHGTDPFQLAVMEQFTLLRYVLFNGLPWLAPEHLKVIDPKDMPHEVLVFEKLLRQLLDDAQGKVTEKAKARLKEIQR